MNVLTADRTPSVLGLRDVLRAWLDHRHEVLVRRSRHRLDALERRLEILAGFLLVYLNLDEVIRIVREEDEPKIALMRSFSLTDLQAESVLNMRLRSLRKLEEMEIRREHDQLSTELRGLQKMLSQESERWKRIVGELQQTRQFFGKGALGDRRTVIAGPPNAIDLQIETHIEREPITVILSEKGWVRAIRGHLTDGAELKFKEGDRLRLLVPCQTNDRLVLLSTAGKSYTLRAGDLPRGRGDGQPIRVVIDLAEADIVACFPLQGDLRYLLASSAGRGFLIKAGDLVAEKRTGKAVLGLKPGEELQLCVPAQGDTVAVIGHNRKLLVFALDQLPEMTRGAGVLLQRYSDGGLRDAKVFASQDGLSWRLSDRVRVESDLRTWRGERGQAGKLPPNGFPKSGRFGDGLC